MKINENITDNTTNHKCSCCGDCCGLFIPFTEKELATIRKYVKEHNIEPTNRINLITGQMNAQCCFLNSKSKKCNIYDVRPFVCRDFKCDHKDWKKRRDLYAKRAKYNSFLEGQKYVKLGTFDDLIYNDPTYIIKFLIENIRAKNSNGIESETLIELFKKCDRLDLLKYITAYTKDNEAISGEQLLKKDF